MFFAGLILVSCSNEETVEKISSSVNLKDEMYNKFMDICMIEDSEIYEKYCECNYSIYNKSSIDEYSQKVEEECLELLIK